MRFRELPPRLQVLIVVQSLAAVATAYTLWRAPDPSKVGLLVFLALCGIIGGACKVNLRLTVGVLSLGFTVTHFTLITLGTAEALLVGFLGALMVTVCNLQHPKRRFYPERALQARAIYNYGNGVLATAAMGWVYHALGGKAGHVDLSTLALPTLGSAFAYYAVNTGGVALAIAWTQNRSPLQEFRRNWAWAWPGYVAGACISAGLLWASQTWRGDTGALLLLPPAYLVYYYYRLRSDKVQGDLDHMREMNRLNDAVIGSLAMAIEAKDRYTRKHLNRVREYAVRLCEKLGVPGDELEAVRIASLLHDIGKIAIPEEILCKPGKLTTEEFEVIKSHVDIGAAILERIRFPWPVASVVRSHHERWDGLGYPRGLKGEEIPMGGRIISLVDVYDALTSDRPYRKAISREQAVQILRAGSGSQFDPVVVETFIALLPEMDAVIARIQEDADEEDEAFLNSIGELVTSLPARHDEVEEGAVLQELTDLAQREAGIVVMAPLLAERLGRLVPYTTFALYLKGVDRRTLVPIHASGLWTELLEGMEIRVGEGVTGYVAARKEPLLNAAAALDLARRLRPGENLELNSTLCVPLTLGEEVVGTLTLYHSAYNFYRPSHVDRLVRAAEFAVQAVEQSRRFQLELPLPAVDRATQLPNQYSLLQFLAGQLNVAQTQEAEFAVVQFALEATFTPSAEQEAPERDLVMRDVARLLTQTVRDGDFVARASGNSFVLVLPGCTEREAGQTAHRIRERAANEGLLERNRSVRMRVGIAVYPASGATPRILLAMARERLSELPESSRPGRPGFVERPTAVDPSAPEPTPAPPLRGK